VFDSKTPRSVILVAAAIVAVTLLGGVLFTTWTARSTEQWMRADLMQKTHLIANALNLENVTSLTGTEADRVSPYYVRLKGQLRSTCQAFENCRFLYLLAKRPDGSIIFLVDSEPMGSQDESGPGQVYEEVSEIMRNVFLAPAPQFEGPTTDRWGTWMTALVPLFNPSSGDVVAVLGMDVDARNWNSEKVRAVFFPVMSAVAMTVILSGAAVLLWHRSRMPVSHGMKWWSRNTEALVTCAIGLALTVILSYELHALEDRGRQETFRRIAMTKAAFVTETLRDLRDTQLAGLASFFEGSMHVERAEFSSFTKYLTDDPMVSAWQWVPVVAADDREKMEESARQDGLPGFAIWETDEFGRRVIAPARPTYYPVFYTEPLTKSDTQLGFDRGSHGAHRAAIEEATRFGLVTATDPMSPTEGEGPYEIFIYWPVFGQKRQVEGFASAILRMDYLLEQGRWQSVDLLAASHLCLFQLRPDGQSVLIATSSDHPHAGGIEGESALCRTKGVGVIVPIFAYGKTYAVSAYPGPHFAALYPARAGWLVAVAGGALTSVLTIFVGFISRRRATLDLIVQQRTADLVRSRERMRVLLSNLPGMAYRRKNAPGRSMEFVSEGSLALTGYSPDELTGAVLFDDIIHPDDRAAVHGGVQERVAHGKGFVIEYRIMTKQGDVKWVWEQGQLVSAPHDKEQVLEGFIMDVTERKNAEVALQESQAELVNAYVAQATMNRVLSEALKEMSLEDILRKSLHIVVEVPFIEFEAVGFIQLVERDPEILFLSAFMNLPDAVKKSCSEVSFGRWLCGRAAATQEIQISRLGDESYGKDGDTISPHTHCAVPILSGGRTLGVLNLYVKQGYALQRREKEFLCAFATVLSEIIMRKKAEEKAEYLVYYDALTGLPSRGLFMDRLRQGIARAERSSRNVAVLIMDIDRFKYVNDAYGQHIGDKVLKDVGERFSSAVRRTDTVARLGNDEFGIALFDIAHSDDILPIMEKVVQFVCAPLDVYGEEVMLTVSTGIAIYPMDGPSPENLVRSAERALALAKKEGRKSFRFYTEDLHVRASHVLLVERRLSRALDNREFVLHYQPYWDIATKDIVGFEALVRWHNPDLGLVAPGKFISVLEDTRMIVEVGEWILGSALQQLRRWEDGGYSVVSVSVNLSLVQFRQRNFARIVENILAESGVAPSLLTLEITESAFIQEVDLIATTLAEFRKMGISISIDDFGTGYSSLAHLKRFPVDNLKIDKSLIWEIAEEPESASIMKAIVSVADTLNLRTIAEGVETEEQWKILRLLKCSMGQGYYVSPPVPAEDAVRFLKKR